MLQDVALGVERIRRLFKLLGAPGETIDLLPDQELPAFPTLRLGIRGLPRRLKLLHPPVRRCERCHLSRDRCGNPRHSLLR